MKQLILNDVAVFLEMNGARKFKNQDHVIHVNYSCLSVYINSMLVSVVLLVLHAGAIYPNVLSRWRMLSQSKKHLYLVDALAFDSD